MTPGGTASSGPTFDPSRNVPSVHGRRLVVECTYYQLTTVLFVGSVLAVRQIVTEPLLEDALPPWTLVSASGTYCTKKCGENTTFYTTCYVLLSSTFYRDAHGKSYVELHFVVSLCVHSKRTMLQRGRDRSSKGAEGEEYLHRVRNYLLGCR